MQNQKLILIGGGGHCKACIDIIERIGFYDIVGILDRPDLLGTSVLNYQIIGSDEDIVKYKEQGCAFLITVGQIRTAEIRKRLFFLLKQNSCLIATLISPLAYVSRYAHVGEGSIIMHGAKINADAQIGENCIINTGANVEHEAIIGDHTHISTSAIVNGNCNIANEVFVGSNATISSQVKIGSNIVVGAGAVVYRDIDESGTYAGNPVKKIN